jgi:hypothetical protein
MTASHGENQNGLRRTQASDARSVKQGPIQGDRAVKSAGLDWRDGDERVAEDAT